MHVGYIVYYNMYLLSTGACIDACAYIVHSNICITIKHLGMLAWLNMYSMGFSHTVYRHHQYFEGDNLTAYTNVRNVTECQETVKMCSILAGAVLGRCARKVGPVVQAFLTQISSECEVQEGYNGVISAIYKYAPSLLFEICKSVPNLVAPVIPVLVHELLVCVSLCFIIPFTTHWHHFSNSSDCSDVE
jgi:hypothetical protein